MIDYSNEKTTVFAEIVDLHEQIAWSYDFVSNASTDQTAWKLPTEMNPS